MYIKKKTSFLYREVCKITSGELKNSLKKKGGGEAEY